jgi:protein kinase C substrate 80K-H
MMFEHGLRCWNGPERSARVELECGAENELLKVSEPSKCEYVMKMKCPAVCTKPQKAAAREEL